MKDISHNQTKDISNANKDISNKEIAEKIVDTPSLGGKDWSVRIKELTRVELESIWKTTYALAIEDIMRRGVATVVSAEQQQFLKRYLENAADLADQAVISYTEHRITHRDIIADSIEHFERATASGVTMDQFSRVEQSETELRKKD
jgi:hypothetical protein